MIKNYAYPQFIGMEAAAVVVGQPMTENQLLVESGCLLRLSAIQCIVNHFFLLYS